MPPPDATFTVVKRFSDNNPATVTVRVSCTSPAIVPAGATTMAQGSPGKVTVSGVAEADKSQITCTAVETQVVGYTGNGTPTGTCSATLAVGTCTITNTLNTANFTVSKIFSDNNPASVSLNVACTSGTVSGGSTGVYPERAGDRHGQEVRRRQDRHLYSE